MKEQSISLLRYSSKEYSSMSESLNEQSEKVKIYNNILMNITKNELLIINKLY